MRTLLWNFGLVRYILPNQKDEKMGWGLVSVADLHENATIFSIPRTLILHPARCHEYIQEDLQTVKDYTDLHPREWMVLFLVLVRLLGEVKEPVLPLTQAYCHYLSLFPDNIVTPLQFTSSELALLEGTNLYHAVSDKLQATLASSERARTWLCQANISKNAVLNNILHAMTELQWVRLWRWADACYSSRSFPPQVGGWSVGDEPILIPGFDALNHRRGEPVTWAFDSAQKVAIFTMRHDISASAQVFNNYGAKSNEELLASYGFVEPGGPDDVLSFALRSSADDPMEMYYWHKSNPNPPLELMKRLSDPLQEGENEVSVLLSRVHGVEALESMVRRRYKAFRTVQREVDDTVAFDGPDGIRESVLNMVKEYRSGKLQYTDQQ